MSSNFEEDKIESLLSALAETEHLTDANQLRKQLQESHNQLAIIHMKHKNYISEIQKLRKQVLELNKERIQTKKQIFEYCFQRDLAEHNIKLVQNELIKVQNELKLKNSMFIKIENERRKLQSQLLLQTTGNKTALSRSASQTNIPKAIDDDLANRQLKCKENEKKLLNNGLFAVYSNKSAEDMDKTLLLQRLLLAKVKEMAERDVQIEENQKKIKEMSQQIMRLRQTKHIAEELTNTRHKLNVKTNQLEGLKLELAKYKEKTAQFIKENQVLKQKLNDFYEHKNENNGKYN